MMLETSLPEVTPVPGALPSDAVAVVVLGGPGSGKGTLSEKLVEQYGLCHLSSGDLLRAEVASGSDLGKACNTLMVDGKLVPDSVGCGLLKNAMIKSGKKAFLLDGFPRSMGQAATFEKQVMAFDFCINLECSEQVMLERLLGRGKTSGRADDNVETIKKRFKTFQTETAPVIGFFKSANKLHTISAEQSPQDVYNSVQKAVGALFQDKLGISADKAKPVSGPVALLPQPSSPAGSIVV
eukprot:scaffold146549_cov55-Prasinocladus_malaysianus.AAC.1